MSATCSPRLSSKHPIDDAARPLPRLETTPPVTKIYLGIRFSMDYLLIAVITRHRRIAGFLFSVETSLSQIFLHLNRFLHRWIECFLYSNQTGTEQAWSFLCASLEFFRRNVVRLTETRQTKEPA